MSGQQGYLRPLPTTKADSVRTNQKHISRKVDTINIASLNVRSMLSNENVAEIENEIAERKIDIIGLSETRREGEK